MTADFTRRKREMSLRAACVIHTAAGVCMCAKVRATGVVEVMDECTSTAIYHEMCYEEFAFVGG